MKLVAKLHDELGGMLVAASMDLAWIDKNSTETNPDVVAKLKRCAETLRNAIDLKRSMIEELRPTLLDNVGLYAALRWHFKGVCTTGGLALHEQYYEPEPEFTAESSVVLFRIAQEALQLIAGHPAVGSVHCSIGIGEEVQFHLTDDSAHSHNGRVEECASYTFLCMTHRVRSLGGHISIAAAPGGGTMIRATIPKARAIETH